MPRLRMLFPLAFLILSTSCALSQVRELVRDGFSSIEWERQKVRDVVEAKRSPLFDNVPFLRLRPGDHLVKARRDQGFSKPSGDPDRLDYYLCSGGAYYDLSAFEENGRLELDATKYALLFDWDFTLANARLLRGLSHDQESLTTAQVAAAIQAVKKEFPEAIQMDSPETVPEAISLPVAYSVKEDTLVSIPGQSEAHFEGLAYEPSSNLLYHYQIRLSSHLYLVSRYAVLRGPRLVDPEWFTPPPDPAASALRSFELSTVPNQVSTERRPLDPEKARIKKAEYERAERFRELVEGAIKANAPER